MITAAEARPRVLVENALPSKVDARAWAVDANTGLSLAFGPGVHAIIGTMADGTHALAPWIGGTARPRSGRVRVDGADPSREPKARAKVGATCDAPILPAYGSVAELFEFAAAFRAFAPDIVDRFGLAGLRDRKVESLSRREARAVDLALALGVREAAAIVVTEPFVDVVLSLERTAITRVMAERASEGAAVIAVTASSHDAIELGTNGNSHLLERGRIVASFSGGDVGAMAPGAFVELHVAVDRPRPLVGALLADANVLAAGWDEAADPELVLVRGANLDGLALAVARAALAADVRVRSVVPAAPSLEELRAANAGRAMAAYHAAYRARGGGA